MSLNNNEISNRTLSQQIADSIIMEIANGVYKPGERLYEMKLTEHYGTSRAPIREALYILEKEGAVERSPRRGVFVKKYTSKEVFDLYDTIYRIEEIALEKACASISESQLEYLTDLIGKMEIEVLNKNIRNYFNLIGDLQLSFFDISGNEILKDIYKQLVARIYRFRFASLSLPSSMDNSLDEYKSIVEGLSERNYEEVKLHLKRKEKRSIEIWKQKIAVWNHKDF